MAEVELDKDEKNRLAEFHRVSSEQLNARLSESPRFFGVLVVTSTGYGYVLWNFDPLKQFAIFVVTSIVVGTYYLAFPRRGQGEAGPLPAYSMT